MSFPTFRAAQVQTNQIIVSGSNGSNARLLVYGSESVTNNLGSYNLPTAGIGSDVFLFISGSKDLVGLANTFGTTVFGGDLLVSGALVSSGNFYVYGNSAFHNLITAEDIQITGLLQLDRTLTSSNGTLLSGTVSNFDGVVDISVDVEHGALIREGLIVTSGIVAGLNGTQLFFQESSSDPHTIKGNINLGEADAGNTTSFANSSSFQAPVKIFVPNEIDATLNGISLYVYSASLTTNGGGVDQILLYEEGGGSNLGLPQDGSVAFFKFIGTAVAEDGNAAATWELDVSAFRSGITVFASSTLVSKHTLGTSSNLAESFDVFATSVNVGESGTPGVRISVNDGTYGSNVVWWGKAINRTECNLSGSFF